jgi:hypothetical protein
MASPPLPLRERAGVRGLFANEIVVVKLTPHPNPLPQGEREHGMVVAQVNS